MDGRAGRSSPRRALTLAPVHRTVLPAWGRTRRNHAVCLHVALCLSLCCLSSLAMQVSILRNVTFLCPHVQSVECIVALVPVGCRFGVIGHGGTSLSPGGGPVQGTARGGQGGGQRVGWWRRRRRRGGAARAAQVLCTRWVLERGKMTADVLGQVGSLAHIADCWVMNITVARLALCLTPSSSWAYVSY